MRVIGGKARGRVLKVPREVSRPTTDRVRESMFGTLAGVLEGAKVLDIFAGSGALGIEALSRGASACSFVERNRGAVRVIEENLKRTGLQDGKVVCGEVEVFLKGERGSYDLIFADPPYADGFRDMARSLVELEGWGNWLAEGGFLVLEQEALDDLPVPAGLSVLQQRDYGRSRIVIYQRISSV